MRSFSGLQRGASAAVGGTVAIVDGEVVFTTSADFNGPASFRYTLQDNGTTNGTNDFKTSTAIVSFTITEVNDAPSGVNDSLTNVAEDSGARTLVLVDGEGRKRHDVGHAHASTTAHISRRRLIADGCRTA